MLAGEVTAGDVVVIRYEGPPRRAGHAGNAVSCTSAIMGRGLGESRRPVDRRPVQRRHPRGVHRPRQPRGRQPAGTIALVERGDTIRIDIPGRSLTLDVPDDVLATRQAAWKRPPAKITHGYLGRYAAMVTSADTGAVLKQTGTMR